MGVDTCVSAGVSGLGVTAEMSLGVGSAAVDVAAGSARNAAALLGPGWPEAPLRRSEEVTSVSEITRPMTVPRRTQNFPRRQIRI